MIKQKQAFRVIDAIEWATEQLRKCEIISAQTEAELMLSFFLNCSRADLYLDRSRLLPESIFSSYKDLTEKRCRGIPLQYLMGETYFYGLKFFIEEGVFIPRPETEVLVEKVIDILKRMPTKLPYVLELCAGSGNISVALTKTLRYCRIMCSDINPKALALARRNAELHGVKRYIEFVKGDLFTGYELKSAPKNKFDLIVANPPYIARRDFDLLPSEVHYEPVNALNGGNDGLVFFNRIVSGCRPYLSCGGYIAFEFGDGQHRQIRKIINQSLLFEEPVFLPDLNGITRFVIARRTDG